MVTSIANFISPVAGSHPCYTIYADEIQSPRAFGQETEVMQLQTEVARRLAGPIGLQSNMEFTFEHMRLAAIQGLLIDADGSTLFDWFAEFGITAATEVAFDLNHASSVDGALRIQCNKVVRAVARASQGAFTTQTVVMGMCGDDFWDALVTHPDVTKTYYNWAAAQELRQGTAFGAMRFGGIDWFNYRAPTTRPRSASHTTRSNSFRATRMGFS
jgi:hypothetical protein